MKCVDYRRVENNHKITIAPIVDERSSPIVSFIVKCANENNKFPTTPPIIPKKRLPKQPLLFPFLNMTRDVARENSYD